MKTLIIYSTKYGATEQIAQNINSKIPGSLICNIKKDSIPNIVDFDCIIIGSSLIVGQASKEIKEFASKNSEILKKCRLGLFLSGMSKDGEEEYFKNNFSQDLNDVAKSKKLLGGIFDPKKCNFLERGVMKAAAKLTEYTSSIDDKLIDKFLQEMAI